MSEARDDAIIGVPIRPRDMITYQSETIVSRMVMMSRQGTVTLFAFDEGQGLSEHTAPFDALAFSLDGEAEITIAGTAHHLREGEMIIMPADIPHAVRPVHRFKMMLIMIHARNGEKKEETPGSDEKIVLKEEGEKSPKKDKKQKKEEKKAKKEKKKGKKQKKNEKKVKKEKKK
ncbi:quercetin dioxygenase-like cupin family protein [Methanocalculus alkaliphilus]|uniref:cupin domain-containing protein n=1 Tax=Methanocalculus alkaliphilus TaxID=768730 RepID=UPI00209EC1F3|nr:cupin domain-containing protein [Methanocalculus alkaliphilus]MCP1716040.1 quercetin dioxygenase-like cupin family protein [Methanocalculus alkaliphilus]